MISVIIPVWNSVTSLETIASDLNLVRNETCEFWELILVDDSSPNEQTWATLQRLANEYGWVKVIRLRRNQGQFRAIVEGLRIAQGDLLVTMDDDLQHPVSEAVLLVEFLREHEEFDCVLGVGQNFRSSRFRNHASSVYHLWESKALGHATVQKSSLRVFRQDLLPSVLSFRLAEPRLGVILPQLTSRIAQVEVNLQRRQVGASGYDLRSLMKLSLKTSTISLFLGVRALTTLGLIGVIGGLLVAVTSVMLFFGGRITLAGYTSTLAVISGFAALNLLGFALVGIILKRIIDELTYSNSAPPRETINVWPNNEG